MTVFSSQHPMVRNDRHKSTFSFHRSSSSPNPRNKDPPTEFICPISGSLMFDPVVVSSGHTYERISSQICRHLRFTPPLPNGAVPDFSTLIPNLALKSTILNWCNTVGIQHPSAPDYCSLQNTVRSKMDSLNRRISESNKYLPENPPVMHKLLAMELNIGSRFHNSSSEESVIANVEILSDENILISNSSSSTSEEEEQILLKLQSFNVFDNNQGLMNLRKITRTNEQTRVSLSTPEILTALRFALTSKYVAVQINAAASIVNLSLEKVNKVKILRSGIVPQLIDVLKGGFSESQEHAAAALFSLALEDINRTAIGVLGGLQPLLHGLKSESERTRHDSALALYNLSLIQSNRVKLIKLGAVSTLLSLLKNDDMAGRVLLILCNLATCVEGKSALLHSNAVKSLVGMLRDDSGVDSESTRENCVAALYSLSQGNMRFKGLAAEAGAPEVFREHLECKLSQLGKEKIKIMLSILRGREIGEVDWDRVMKRGPSQNGCDISNSIEF